MADTQRLGLPLLAPAQAQKHVTVNEALARLDALVQMVLVSVAASVPPGAAFDGQTWAVPAGATGAWAGQAGKLAVALNGGWEFLTPERGWRAFVADTGRDAVFDGTGWRAGQSTLTESGAGILMQSDEADHVISPGTVSQTGTLIPAHAVVLGVTARVVETITGTLSSWSLGNPGAAGRYGAGLGLDAGSFARGTMSQPTAFYTDEVLQLDAVGGAFAGGTVRLAVHYLSLSLPAA
jgi:hypothetical protein